MATTSCLDRLLADMLDLRVDSELETRIGDLRWKANSGTLPPAEDAEYKDLVEALISIMQAKARKQRAWHRPRRA